MAVALWLIPLPRLPLAPLCMYISSGRSERIYISLIYELLPLSIVGIVVPVFAVDVGYFWALARWQHVAGTAAT